MDSSKTSAEHSLALRNTEIERRYLAGETVKEIAASYSLAPITIYKILEQRGVSMLNRTPETQLLEQIREAYRALGPTMRVRDYDAYAKSRGWRGHQTLILRFGKWSSACERAGVPVQTRRYRRKRKDFTNRKTCLDAVRYVRDALGHIPSTNEYDRYARTAPELPCIAVVRRRCGGWRGVLRVLLMDAGPQEASGK